MKITGRRSRRLTHRKSRMSAAVITTAPLCRPVVVVYNLERIICAGVDASPHMKPPVKTLLRDDFGPGVMVLGWFWVFGP